MLSHTARHYFYSPLPKPSHCHCHVTIRDEATTGSVVRSVTFSAFSPFSDSAAAAVSSGELVIHRRRPPASPSSLFTASTPPTATAPFTACSPSLQLSRNFVFFPSLNPGSQSGSLPPPPSCGSFKWEGRGRGRNLGSLLNCAKERKRAPSFLPSFLPITASTVTFFPPPPRRLPLTD